MTDPDVPHTGSSWRAAPGLVLAALILAGFALRLPLFDRFPLREDEAIYSYWALHGWTIDPFFLDVWPDKPPLFLWLQGLALQTWGHSPETGQAAARWVNILASTLTIPVLAVTARRWWGQSAAVMAAALAAFNPFAVSFAATAFTDPVLVLAGSLALALAAYNRPLWSGLCLGAAIMTKQQGLLFAPLVIGALAVGFREDPLPGRGGSSRKRGEPALRRTPPNEFGGCRMRNRLKPVGVYAGSFVLGLGMVVAPVLYWDSLRWAVAPSPWDLGVTNVGGVGFLPPAAWPARAAAWGALAYSLLASPWAWGAYALVLFAAVTVTARRRSAARWLPALLLGGWGAGFLLVHIATSVQVWDRYLLPLTIPLVLLGAWAVDTSRRCLPRGGPYLAEVPTSRRSLAILALLLLVSWDPGWRAAQGGLPVGGDHGDYAGLNEALAAVDQSGSLLFHRELGWHARFALFDDVRSGDVQLRYYPSAAYLADSATKSPHKQRFVIVPDWSPLPDLPLHLGMRGLEAQVVLRAGHFTVYQIDERPSGDTSWRVCAPRRAEPF